MQETVAIAGGGTIACGIAAVAAAHGDVTTLVRSDTAAQRVRDRLERMAEREERLDPASVAIVQDPAELAGAGVTFAIEAVAEQPDVKAEVHRALHQALDEEAVIATTTSSLSIAELAGRCGRADRFIGLHVFNPVHSMKLVELARAPATSDETVARARAFCEHLGKRAVEVPDMPGFVVNRLLFPFLFDAVRLLEHSEMAPAEIDTCMKLGAGHPMGPLALLDFVGLDVAAAIGRSLGEELPAHMEELIAQGALGHKSGRGFHDYD